MNIPGWTDGLPPQDAEYWRRAVERARIDLAALLDKWQRERAVADRNAYDDWSLVHYTEDF